MISKPRVGARVSSPVTQAAVVTLLAILFGLPTVGHAIHGQSSADESLFYRVYTGLILLVVAVGLVIIYWIRRGGAQPAHGAPANDQTATRTFGRSQTVRSP
jgi:protein-S-isoprenylcysteine O-methyltransferase Ste14